MKSKSGEDPLDLHFSTLAIISRLGRGSSSHVFKTQSIKSKQYYAMKVIDKKSSSYEPVALGKQISIHRLLKNEYIPKFVKHFEDESNHYLLTEYCQKGEITKLLMKPPKEKKLWKILAHVSSALLYMHNQIGVAHGDVKLSNILISASSYKLCDFGFSNFLHHSGQSVSGPFGTLMYMAPEILRGTSHKIYAQSDIWALGICILTLMSQGNPYKTDSTSELKKKILNSEYIKIDHTHFPQYSPQLRDLVSRMLEPNHEARITAQDIVEKIRQYAHILAFGKDREQDCEEIKMISITETQVEGVEGEVQKEIREGNQQDHGREEEDVLLDLLERKSYEKESEEENKSIFNSTSDTLFDQQQSILTLPQTRYWTHSLKPQKHTTQTTGHIEILTNRSTEIRINQLQYRLDPCCTSLTMTKQKSPKCYTLPQIISIDKINNLYNYAIDLILVLKKKQCLKEEIIAGRYYWLGRGTMGCVGGDGLLVQRNLRDGRVEMVRVGTGSGGADGFGKVEVERCAEYIRKGEEFFLNNL